MTVSRVRQLRVVVTADDFDQAVAFYRDILGLTEQAAFEGDGDARAVTASLSSAGAEVIGGPAVTPWNSLNSRLRAPAGVQLTLFEELGG
jgi:catechol 2,3-dioxygenase-like lactoylglutathione lyase family enzyme